MYVVDKCSPSLPADSLTHCIIQDQWQKKKQTKEERRAAKKAKLDPKNYKSALDVHKENERKRKREIDGEKASAAEPGTSDHLKKGLRMEETQTKRQKTDNKTSKESTSKELTAEEDETIRREKAEKRRQQRERKKEKKLQKSEKKALKKAQKTDPTAKKPTDCKSTTASTKRSNTSKEDDDSGSDSEAGEPAKQPRFSSSKKNAARKEPEKNYLDDASSIDDDELAHGIDLSLDNLDEHTGSASGDEDQASIASSDPDTPTFDNSAQGSSASSTSSIVPPAEPRSDDNESKASAPRPLKQPTKQVPLPSIPASEQEQQQHEKETEKYPKFTEADSEKLKERLEARLTALRAARKADGPNGKPARNRQELIDARRQKQERRKQHKKELRQKAREEQSAEAEAARLRGGSGSPMWSPNAVLSPREPQNNFSFGKMAFGDGREVDVDSGVSEKKKKGPQDVKTALEAAKKKQDRVSGLDEGKRQNIEEKGRWLNASKRVQGEKVRDNTSLLKKTLKRKEKGKSKSEKEWNERIDGVQAGREAKQKKREENLRQRKEGKGAKKGGSKPAAATKPKKRPGFEGSWKLGSKGGRGP